jgi:hypothetical protein
MAEDRDPTGVSVALAEFEALRAEILQISNSQWSILALQLTAAGVVFSFALSSAGHIGFLLILPVITYAFTGVYVDHHFEIQQVAAYIREVLEPKLGGHLHWETWLRRNPPKLQTRVWLHPLFLTFPAVAAVAIIWVSAYVWMSLSIPTGKRVLLIIIWFVGIFATLLSFQLIVKLFRVGGSADVV